MTNFFTKIISFAFALFAFLIFCPLIFIYTLFFFFTIALFKMCDFLARLCVTSLYAGKEL